MKDFTIKKIEEFDFYDGEYKKPGIKFIYAAKGLGVTAWGMNVIQIEPNCAEYPEHEHSEDGQEEVYTLLDGKAKIDIEGEQYDLVPGVMVRVGPKTKRKIVTSDLGATVLAIGSTPGKAYEVKA